MAIRKGNTELIVPCSYKDMGNEETCSSRVVTVQLGKTR